MGFAAIPAIMMGASAVGGALSGRRSGKRVESQAITRSPEEIQAGKGALDTAGVFGNLGSSLYRSGAGLQDRAAGYYSTMLGRGGRSAMEAAVAPQAESISSGYRGLTRNIKSSYLRGGVRDLALAQAERDKTGQISRLTQGMQPMAAAALGGIGSERIGRGLGAFGSAGGLFSDLMGQGRADRSLKFDAARDSENRTADVGQSLGSLLFTALASGAGKGGGGSNFRYTPLPVGG